MASQAYVEAMQAWIAWNKTVDLSASLDVQRRSYEDMFVRSTPMPDNVDVQEVDAHGVQAEWVSAAGAGRGVILFFHGGGYLVGSSKACRGFAARLSQATGRRVCSVDYRLSPEHPYPAALEDAVQAYRWLLDQKVAPRDIVIVGESAGGGLSLAMMMSLRDAGTSLPSCAVLISPWVDLAVTGDSARPGAADDPLVAIATLNIMASLYVGAETKTPLASPLYGDLSRLPPMLLMAGGSEVLRDDAIRLAARAADCGSRADLFIAPGMVHIWPLVAPLSPEAAEALERARQFIDAKR